MNITAETEWLIVCHDGQYFTFTGDERVVIVTINMHFAMTGKMPDSVRYTNNRYETMYLYEAKLPMTKDEFIRKAITEYFK